MNFEFFLILCGIIFLCGIVFLLRKKNPRISQKNLQIFAEKIRATKKLAPAHSLIESHKIFVAAIKKIGDKNLTAAKNIAKFSKNFPNEKKIWQLHRLRNCAAHETDFSFSEKNAAAARTEFLRALRAISE